MHCGPCSLITIIQESVQSLVISGYLLLSTQRRPNLNWPEGYPHISKDLVQHFHSPSVEEAMNGRRRGDGNIRVLLNAGKRKEKVIHMSVKRNGRR